MLMLKVTKLNYQINISHAYHAYIVFDACKLNEES